MEYLSQTLDMEDQAAWELFLNEQLASSDFRSRKTTLGLRAVLDARNEAKLQYETIVKSSNTQGERMSLFILTVGYINLGEGDVAEVLHI